jgi:hypothetical protein
MAHTIRVTATVPESRVIEMTLPVEVMPGEVELMVTVNPVGEDGDVATLQALVDSGIEGMWADRTDVSDPVAFARQLREQAWKRSA